MRARRVVVAVPPTLAGRIAYGRPLPAARDQLTQRMPQGSVIKCLAVYDEPFWRADGLAGRSSPTRARSRSPTTTRRPSGRPGVLLGFVEGDAARELTRRSARERARVVSAEFARYFGPRAGRPRKLILQDWSEAEWTRGCYEAFAPPGVLTEYGDALRAPSGASTGPARRRRPTGRATWTGRCPRANAPRARCSRASSPARGATTVGWWSPRAPTTPCAPPAGRCSPCSSPNGSFFGAWATRIPAIRDRLDLSDGQLGLALAAIALGAIVAMPPAGGLAARVGSRTATRGALVVAAVATASVAYAPSFGAFVALTFLFGVGMGSLDVAMNAHGVTVERRFGRPILSSFHAGFSAGGLVGGVLGGLVAAAGVDPRVHLPLAAALGLLVMLAASRWFLPDRADAGGRAEPVLVRPPRRLWAMGALAFSGLLVEGACGDWSAVYLHDELGTSAGLAAAGFTAFSVAMVLGRTFGDRLVQALGPVRMVRAGGALAAVGLRAGARRRVAGGRGAGLRLPGRGRLLHRAARLPRGRARARGWRPAWPSARCRAWATPGSWPGRRSSARWPS